MPILVTNSILLTRKIVPTYGIQLYPIQMTLVMITTQPLGIDSYAVGDVPYKLEKSLKIPKE
jgi:hypothetical protein